MRAAAYVRRILLLLCSAALASARGERSERPSDSDLIARSKIGPGRSQFVRHNGLVWTVAIPAGKTGQEGVAEQTRLALADLDQRLAAAGTDKTRVIDAVVFLSDVSALPEMDKVWVDWCPEGCEPSRCCVGASLPHGMKVEIKVTAAAGDAGRGAPPGLAAGLLLGVALGVGAAVLLR